MATPRVILRYRELTPGIDTIQAHLAVIEKHQIVWWGWWKKALEPDHSKELYILQHRVSKADPACAWLLDTSAERLHRANLICVATKLAEADRPMVPEYYRANIDKIPAWFCLSGIEVDCKYDPLIEEKIGQQTLLILDL